MDDTRMELPRGVEPRSLEYETSALATMLREQMASAWGRQLRTALPRTLSNWANA